MTVPQPFRTGPQRFRSALAALTACSTFIAAVTPAVIATGQAQSPPPAGKSAATPPKAATPTAPTTPGAARDGGWPRDFILDNGTAVRVYQPQVASWDGQQHMIAFAAVSATPKGSDKATLGTAKIEADTVVAVGERLVNFSMFKLTDVNLPGLSDADRKDVVSGIEKMVPTNAMVIALDRVLGSVDKSRIIPKNVNGVKADPPVVFYSTSTAVLVNVDGDPIWSPIKDNDLKFAVNTNWDLFQHATSKKLYLRHGDAWLTADALTGPWQPTTKLPDSFAKLPADDNWKDVKAALPGRELTKETAPKVFVSTKPAELILLRGAPNYVQVTGTQLLWVSNTDSDVFRAGKGGTIYYLVSGRWFSASDFAGPWTFATPNLPPDFKKIPESHARSRVLASVPGSDEAAEAVLLAQIPETASVDKKTVKAPAVEYQGEPQFQAIEQTTVSRAANTDKDIIKVGDLYYMCFQGVWFMGRSPNGPWEVTGSVPKEIYEIPPSSPAHNVTYVTVVEDNNDTAVYATAAAYTGLMVAWGCAVWGTGYYYPPYVGYGGFYPAYYPYYPTYGFHASYNPWTGTYSRGVAAYGPYGGAGVGARYNPRTGTYARGAAAWGPYGARGYASAYNPRTGAVGATRQGSSVYGSWGQTGVRRGNDWATTSRVTNRVTGNTTRVTQGSGGGEAITRRGPTGTGGVARTGSGDVYAGRDGNVYKKQGDSWQKYDNGSGSWNNVQATEAQRQQATERASQAQANANEARSRASTDTATMNQLNRDSSARAEGAQRTQSAGSSSTRSSGSYRPSSGGRSMRGGGRRR